MECSARPPRRERPVRQPVLLGLFAGVGVAVGYLLSGVPGVELMTLVACLAGVALGPAGGAAAGGLAEAVYSLGSPYGIAAPPLLAAQILGVAAAGLLGGLAGPLLVRGGRKPRGAVLAGALGAAAALLFDLLTNLGIMLGYGLDWRAVLAGAVGMAAVHLVVNAAVFAAVLPAAAPRVVLLRRGALRGGPAAVLALAWLLGPVAGARAQEPALAAADTTAAAAADTAVVAAPADTAAGGRTLPAPVAPVAGGPATLGWQRALWTPFANHALNRLDWWSPRVTAAEAGTAGPALVLGEAGTSPLPLVTIDGVPWGTGHALADDPWLIPQQGLRWAEGNGFDADGAGGGWFADGLGGTAGTLALVTHDPDPARSFSTYRGVKGRHESYMRGIDLLTAAAPWRVAFAFEEVLDNEAWNYTDGPAEAFRPDDSFYPGHGKARQSRTRLQRELDRENRLTLEFSNARKTRNDAPAWDADQLEIWDTGVSAAMDGAAAGMRWRGFVHWRDRDVQWADRDPGGDTLVNARKVETAREGLVLELGPRGRSGAPAPLAVVRLAYHEWSVADRSDTVRARPEDLGPVDGRGRQVRAEGGTGWRFGPHRATLAASGTWDERIDIAPGWAAVLQEEAPRPRWRLELAGDGRAPRSDELLTPYERYIDGRRLTILPNFHLERERTLRAGLALRARLLGTGLALDAAARRLEDGIVWVTRPGEVTVGRWENGLDMDSARITGRLERQGRFLGWGRALLEGTWQSFDERAGRASLLPPQNSGRLALFWENHVFREDGILQLGLIGYWQGEMADPWDVSRTYRLPSRTVLDLLVGFRLVGADLCLAFRNLTGERTRLSAGTWSSGQEMDMRLQWSFRH